MKLRKLTVSFCACLLLMLCLTGCGARSAVTEEAFTAAMDELNFSEQQMDDNSIEQARASGVESYRVYITSGAGSAAYCLYGDSDSARQAYATMVAAMGSEDAKKTKSVDSATYNRAEFTGDGGMLVIIRTDSTLVTVSDTEANVKEILAKLGV